MGYSISPTSNGPLSWSHWMNLSSRYVGNNFSIGRTAPSMHNIACVIATYGKSIGTFRTICFLPPILSKPTFHSVGMNMKMAIFDWCLWRQCVWVFFYALRIECENDNRVREWQGVCLRNQYIWFIVAGYKIISSILHISQLLKFEILFKRTVHTDVNENMWILNIKNSNKM